MTCAVLLKASGLKMTLWHQLKTSFAFTITLTAINHMGQDILYVTSQDIHKNRNNTSQSLNTSDCHIYRSRTTSA